MRYAALFLETLGGFVLSWLTGFTIGRYIVIAPLLVTAYAVSKDGPTILKAGAATAAVLLYVLFSFVFFGAVTLQTALIIECSICVLGYAVLFAARRGQARD
ncbi:MAG: hypothetical protein M3082_19215 [Candidatus Dormibacteraeota bacterium]|nr:hypothetical protein [Candidatus Dormibacteraeota bacterium]